MNNLTTGIAGCGIDVMQENTDFSIQVDLALNYDSPGATAIASSSIVTSQLNFLAAGNVGQRGNVSQTNNNINIQIDLAVDINSPNAVATADSSDAKTQSNELSMVGGLTSGNIVKLNSSQTIQFGVTLNINSPGAVENVSSDATIFQADSISMLPKGVELMLADLGVPGFASGGTGAVGSSTLVQHEPDLGSLAALLPIGDLMDVMPMRQS
jgi:hypothetical protein